MSDCVICCESSTFSTVCCKQAMCLQCLFNLERKQCSACRCEPLEIIDQNGKTISIPNTRGYTQHDPHNPHIGTDTHIRNLIQQIPHIEESDDLPSIYSGPNGIWDNETEYDVAIEAVRNHINSGGDIRTIVDIARQAIRDLRLRFNMIPIQQQLNELTEKYNETIRTMESLAKNSLAEKLDYNCKVTAEPLLKRWFGENWATRENYLKVEEATKRCCAKYKSGNKQGQRCVNHRILVDCNGISDYFCSKHSKFDSSTTYEWRISSKLFDNVRPLFVYRGIDVKGKY